LGFAHPDILLDQITSSQLSEWEAYDKIDPVGDWKEDFRMAYMCSLITNIARAVHGKKGAKMSSPSEFLPEWLSKEVKGDVDLPKQQSLVEMKTILRGIASAYPNKKKGEN